MSSVQTSRLSRSFFLLLAAGLLIFGGILTQKLRAAKPIPAPDMHNVKTDDDRIRHFPCSVGPGKRPPVLLPYSM